MLGLGWDLDRLFPGVHGAVRQGVPLRRNRLFAFRAYCCAVSGGHAHRRTHRFLSRSSGCRHLFGTLDTLMYWYAVGDSPTARATWLMASGLTMSSSGPPQPGDCAAVKRTPPLSLLSLSVCLSVCLSVSPRPAMSPAQAYLVSKMKRNPPPSCSGDALSVTTSKIRARCEEPPGTRAAVPHSWGSHAMWALRACVRLSR